MGRGSAMQQVGLSVALTSALLLLSLDAALATTLSSVAAPETARVRRRSLATDTSTSEPVITYMPGNLTVVNDHMTLSTGLSARVIAQSGESVVYPNGTVSSLPVHFIPDYGATFVDTSNPDGWIYVSNSEMKSIGEGSVGAFTFDAQGEIVDYRRVLTGSNANCGGQALPWGAFISCEEWAYGVIWQVSPSGMREPAQITLGAGLGEFESFAYHIENKSSPEFYVSEDAKSGAVRRFVPTSPDWEDPWSILLGEGKVDYLMIEPNEDDLHAGIFRWTDSRVLAHMSALMFYPESEGINCVDGKLYFLAKKMKRLFILDLEAGTYTSESTKGGYFGGEPDQILYLGEPGERLFFFTEDVGTPGIHARTQQGQHYTLLETHHDLYSTDETTGLAFSPDRRHMYFTLQEHGIIFEVTRDDGLAFDDETLEVTYYSTEEE